MADVATNVQVTPQVTLNAPPPNSDVLAAAILKASENQAVSTAALASALRPAAQPSGLLGLSNQHIKLVLVGLIAFLLWK